MNISPINIQTFKGHGAGKIKTLYMQNGTQEPLINIYNQMRMIGEKEGFKVYMHDRDELKNEWLFEPNNQFCPWEIWSQDNKILVKKNNETTLMYSKAFPAKELDEAIQLAQKAGFKAETTGIMLDGGNIFIGEKDDGENYFMTSLWMLYLCGAYEYLKSKNIKGLTFSTVGQFASTSEVKNFRSETIASANEYNGNKSHWQRKAQETISKDFNVKPENIFILPDAEFHLDMFIRPLEFPYVLVNDEKRTDEILDELKEEFKNNRRSLAQIDTIKSKLEKRRQKYHGTEEVCQSLKTKGFIPIKIAGMYGLGEPNYINAIVHKNEDGLIYITNSSKPGTKIEEALQDIFEKDLKEKCPEIKRVHFVSGKKYGNTNDIMACLSLNGGIHCLCAEEMA